MWKSSSSRSGEAVLNDFKYEIDLKAGCIFVKHENSVTPQQIIERQTNILNDRQHRPNLNRLVDMRGCSCDIGAEDIANIANIQHNHVEKIGGFKQAMLLNDSLEHRTMRLLISSMSDFTISYQTFLDTEANLQENLRNWLGIQEDHQFPHFISF
jgi:hypothetical protein